MRSKTEVSFLTHIPASYARNGLNRASNAATLVGLEAPGRLRNVDVKGYALGSAITNRTATPAISNRGEGEFGADVKWGVTQSYVADFTYNTDFAQVEDDEQQVNLTRFSLFFPEKREFFMEGSAFFSFGVQGIGNNGDLPMIFFSRRIGLENGGAVPIVGGGRVLGRSGPYRVGVLTMRTGDAPALNAMATDFSVVRVQRDILRRSRVGVIGTRRAPSSNGDATRNYAYGADAVLQFYENVSFTEYIAKTDTPGRTGDSLSYRSRFAWNPDLWGVDVEHLFAGKDFNPEVGYIRRPEGFRRTHGKFEFSPRPKHIPGVRKLTYAADVEYYTDPSGRNVQSRDQQGTFKVDYTSGDAMQVEANRTFEGVDESFPAAKNVRIPVGGYDYTQLKGSYTFGPQRKVSGTAAARYGGFYEGTLHELSWKSRVEFSPQFYAEPTVSWNRVDVPWGKGSNNLASSRLTYTMSPRMFVSPGSELFIVDSDGRSTLTRGVPDLQNRSFVVKVTRLFQL